jgi:DNA helicase-2/ATP-dependent DNA helicase PcrA
MPLTTEQNQPVNEEIDNKLVLAGPGTGKSFTILGFINYLLSQKNIPPSSILVITFTRAATNELKQKIRNGLGESSELPNIFTLHGFSLRQLMRNSENISALPKGFSIANDFEERYLIMEDIKSILNISKIKEIKELFNLLSANWETLNIEDGDWKITFPNPQFLGAWQEHRSIYGYMLRTELVYQLKKALEQDENIKLDSPIEYLIVDEYQDLNKCDLAIINHLLTQGIKIFCAGDDDQSIYGFRYAYPEGIRNFCSVVPNSKEFKLTECFRCDKEILKLALNVIGQDFKRIPKNLKSMSGLKGEYHLLRFPDQYVEAQKIAAIARDLVDKKKIPENEIIILLRSDHNGNFSNVIVDELVKQNITINQDSNALTAFEEESGRYFLSLLKFLKNPSHDLALRTLLELTQGLGEATFVSIYEKAKAYNTRFHTIVEKIYNGEITDIRNLARLKEALLALYKLQKEISEEKDILNALEKFKNFIPKYNTQFFEKLKEIVETKELESIEQLIEYADDLLGPSKEAPDEKITGIRIMSMHQAKGLTAQAVFIAAAEEEYIPGRGNIEEERRLLYVSITRAKHFLFITSCNDRMHNQKHSGYMTGETTTKRHLTRYLRDLPIITSENGHTFKLK